MGWLLGRRHQESPQNRGGAAHVFAHQLHGVARFNLQAARIKTDALAAQAPGCCRRFLAAFGGAGPADMQQARSAIGGPRRQLLNGRQRLVRQGFGVENLAFRPVPRIAWRARRTNSAGPRLAAGVLVKSRANCWAWLSAVTAATAACCQSTKRRSRLAGPGLLVVLKTGKPALRPTANNCPRSGSVGVMTSIFCAFSLASTRPTRWPRRRQATVGVAVHAVAHFVDDDDGVGGERPRGTTVTPLFVCCRRWLAMTRISSGASLSGKTTQVLLARLAPWLNEMSDGFAEVLADVLADVLAGGMVELQRRAGR